MQKHPGHKLHSCIVLMKCCLACHLTSTHLVYLCVVRVVSHSITLIPGPLQAAVSIENLPAWHCSTPLHCGLQRPQTDHTPRLNL